MVSPTRRIGVEARIARRLCQIVLAICGIVAISGTSFAAETWPSRTVKVIVPYPAGGSTDALARLVTRKLSDSLGQPFIVENRAGANGNIGAGAVVAAPPDGYTLLFTTTGPLVFNRLIYKSTTTFDPAKDFTPIVEVASIPLVIAAHPSAAMKTMADLVAYAKANPGKLTYGTSGKGSMGHLTAEMLQRDFGIKMTHVPYRGSAPALTDLVAGTISLNLDLPPMYVEYVQSGALRALAITSATRYPALPDVPTLTEQGAKGFDVTGWIAIAGPAGMAADVTKKINGAVNDYLSSSEGKSALTKLGMQPSGGTPEQLAALMAAELEKWRPITETMEPNE
jgi:tripartite-type tricarboxylate transporter receptor subunit TctC